MSSTLRQLRENARLTQAELATRSGIRQATISGLENGHTSPQSSTIQALATALKTTPKPNPRSAQRSHHRQHRSHQSDGQSRLAFPSRSRSRSTQRPCNLTRHQLNPLVHRSRRQHHHRRRHPLCPHRRPHHQRQDPARTPRDPRPRPSTRAHGIMDSPSQTRQHRTAPPTPPRRDGRCPGRFPITHRQVEIRTQRH
ncbi:MAG: transcriptional regulator with XRE-family HTH domain [Pseudoalteromonas tetraodonis]|jgi:transcriptional regulator with XRE-family HTH domain